MFTFRYIGDVNRRSISAKIFFVWFQDYCLIFILCFGHCVVPWKSIRSFPFERSVIPAQLYQHSQHHAATQWAGCVCVDNSGVQNPKMLPINWLLLATNSQHEMAVSPLSKGRCLPECGPIDDQYTGLIWQFVPSNVCLFNLYKISVTFLMPLLQ